MNNLIQNYKIILRELVNTCQNIKTSTKIRMPKLSDMELVALNITSEYMSIWSELQPFRRLKDSELEYRIERSVYNKRKRALFNYIEEIRVLLSSRFSDFTDVFVVDSAPIEICRASRAGRSGICSTEHIKPAFGHCASQKTRYFRYKLHAVCDKNGIFHFFDFTPANVHDVNYLQDIKGNFKNCLLIGDRGYIGREIQADLFNCSNITLSVPMRKNQNDFVKFSSIRSKIRKRIETNISQLNGQFSININFAKTFQGLATRILSKITAFTMIQYLNFFVFKRSLNKLKVNLS